MDLAAALGDWSGGRGALYRQLAAGLREAIEAGRIPAGSRLPPERNLARALAVSRSTVVAAYQVLRADGWVESRQGSGTKVRAQPPRAGDALPDRVEPGPGELIFRRLIEGPGRTLSLALACVAPGDESVLEAAVAASREDLTLLLESAGYAPLGLPSLRREVAALLTRTGLPTGEDQVLITTGAQQAINLAAAFLVKPGDVVVVEDPGFSGTLDALRTAGARLVGVPVDQEGVDVGALEDVVARASPVAAYLMPSFHNPTGACLSETRRRRLARVAAAHRLPVIEDDTLQFTFLSSPPPPPLGAFSADAPVLTVGSLSKVLWGGLRLGWLRAPEPTIARLARLKAVHDLGSPLLDQAVAARLLPRLESIAEGRRHNLADDVARTTGLLRQHLPSWTWQPPEGGLALWVRLPGGNGDEFAQVALRHGVEVVPGSTMSPDGHFRDHLRLAVTLPAPLMEEAAVRLARAWAAYVPATEELPALRVVV